MRTLRLVEPAEKDVVVEIRCSGQRNPCIHTFPADQAGVELENDCARVLLLTQPERFEELS